VEPQHKLHLAVQLLGFLDNMGSGFPVRRILIECSLAGTALDEYLKPLPAKAHHCVRYQRHPPFARDAFPYNANAHGILPLLPQQNYQKGHRHRKI
jgi:hypothetical protein